jgi:NhaP-type Na+/H+ or K+/H+ antiporter
MLGFAFRHLMKFCQRHDLIDRHSYVAQYISLAFLTIGVTTLLGSDDLLSTFFCGTAFAWDGFFNQQTEEAVFSSVIDTLFNVAAFIFVGAWMPFDAFQNAATTLTVWRLIVIAILVLMFRRLPIMIICYKWIPDIKTFREAVFCGHFGPIGIGGVFISTLAVEALHDANLSEENHQAELLKQTIQPIVAFMVLCSIVIHGLSVPSFSLGRRVHSVSRTWSRRDTTGSQGPEWANQARMVTRGEDIIINRDHPGSEVDLEVGDSGGSSSSYLAQKRAAQEKHQHRLHHPDQKPYSEKHAAAEEDLERTESVRSADVDMRANSNLTDETRVQQGTEAGGSGKATRNHSPAPPHSRVDSREEVPPDGSETLMEWIEGNHKVIETRAGPGDDVRVYILTTRMFCC